MGGTCGTCGAIRKCIYSFSGKPEGKRSLGTPRYRFEYNIKMNLKKVGCVAGDWTTVAYDRDKWRVYVRAVMNLQVH